MVRQNHLKDHFSVPCLNFSQLTCVYLPQPISEEAPPASLTQPWQLRDDSCFSAYVCLTTEPI